MGRSRAYDEDAVLTGAMHAFRRRGYAGASIRDLEHATGLKAGSIYNSFGDKTGLFDAAFAHYNRAILGRRIANHAPTAAGLRGLRDLFLSLLRESNAESFGCLITNSAVEFGWEGGPHPGVREGLQTLESTFAERLRVAQLEDKLPPGVDPAAAAVKLLALYQGVLVLIRAGYDKAALRRMINQEFEAIEIRS
jgi:TetR/AcrR family transcriptional regulator, transcriptional repressor for nem operon